MSGLKRWLARLAGSFSVARSERDLAEELESHLQMEIDELVRRGVSPIEARRRAVIHSGGLEAAKEAYRDQRGFPAIDHLRRDLRYAGRMIRRSPGLTVIAVVSLGLAIGANTAVFSLADAVFFRTLPVTDPEELVLLEWVGPGEVTNEGTFWNGYSGSIRASKTAGEVIGTSFSIPLFERVQASATTLSGVFAFAPIEQLNVVHAGEAGIARGQLVTGAYYRTLGVRAVLGRTLGPSDDRPGAEAVAVLSYRFWQNRFGGDPSILGRVVRISGVPATIIGVTASEFVGTLEVGESADVTLPMSLGPSFSPGMTAGDLADSRSWWAQIIGRRRPDVTAEQVSAELEVIIGQALRHTDAGEGPAPADTEAPGTLRPRVVSGAHGPDDERRDYGLATALLTLVAGLVLLLACTNVASLLLSRAASRRREITMRLALGASRKRLIAQLLTEVAVLALCAEGVGLLVAIWGKNLLRVLRPSASGIDLALDGRAFAVATLIAASTTILCGLAPALHATRVELAHSLKSAARTTHGRARSSFRGTLLVAQISMSVVLLFGSTLFLGTLRNLYAIDAGFDQDRVLLFRIDPRLSQYDAERVPALYRQLLQAYGAIPGVDAVSFARHSLLTGSQRSSSVEIAGDPERLELATLVNAVGPGYLETMRIPLRAGRDFDGRDDERGRGVAVVNEAFARARLPGEDPLGRVLRVSGQEWEIVGISSDARYHSVRERAEPTVYLPFLRAERGQAAFSMRSTLDPSTLVGPVREATRDIDPTLAIFDVSTQREAVRATLGEERVLATTTTAFGLLALILAAIGVYGVISYTASQRTSEIGLRIALGATGTNVLWLVARHTIVLVTLGVAIGSIASVITSGHFSRLLYGLTPADPESMLITVGVIAAIAFTAAFIPANRARRVSPLVALRHE